MHADVWVAHIQRDLKWMLTKIKLIKFWCEEIKHNFQRKYPRSVCEAEMSPSPLILILLVGIFIVIKSRTHRPRRTHSHTSVRHVHSTVRTLVAEVNTLRVLLGDDRQSHRLCCVGGRGHLHLSCLDLWKIQCNFSFIGSSSVARVYSSRNFPLTTATQLHSILWISAHKTSMGFQT